MCVEVQAGDEGDAQCGECGRHYRRTKSWQRWCSAKCRNAYHNLRRANAPAVSPVEPGEITKLREMTRSLIDFALAQKAEIETLRKACLREGVLAERATESQRRLARHLLGVRYGAGAEEIREAYRQKAKLLHPDRGGDADLFNGLTDGCQVLLGDAREHGRDR